jgi:hypothetical protein
MKKTPEIEKKHHAVQFYKDEESLAKTVGQFLADGFQIGEPAILVATPSHTDAVQAELEAAGFDVQHLRRTRELQLFDARKMLSGFMTNGVPDPLLFKSNLGDAIDRLCAGRPPCPIRAYGEMVDLLWQEGNQEGAIRLEILWNQLASEYEFSLLCGYAVGNFYKETQHSRMQDICRHHSHVITT